MIFKVYPFKVQHHRTSGKDEILLFHEFFIQNGNKTIHIDMFWKEEFKTILEMGFLTIFIIMIVSPELKISSKNGPFSSGWETHVGTRKKIFL